MPFKIADYNNIRNKHDTAYLHCRQRLDATFRGTARKTLRPHGGPLRPRLNRLGYSGRRTDRHTPTLDSARTSSKQAMPSNTSISCTAGTTSTIACNQPSSASPNTVGILTFRLLKHGATASYTVRCVLSSTRRYRCVLLTQRYPSQYVHLFTKWLHYHTEPSFFVLVFCFLFLQEQETMTSIGLHEKIWWLKLCSRRQTNKPVLVSRGHVVLNVLCNLQNPIIAWKSTEVHNRIVTSRNKVPLG
jgi:hypothetical protein